MKRLGYHVKHLCAPFVLLCAAQHATAGTIDFDPARNRITVAGYPEEEPATLSDLLAADEAGGWGLVSRCHESDVYTVKASLWIGTNTDWGTFFQVGSPDHPRETLILHGDLTVAPPRSMGLRVEHWRDYAGGRRDGRYRVSNRLTLGMKGHQEIRPAVKIACSRKDEFAVRVLADPLPSDSRDRWYVPMGELFMFNALLTAAVPDMNHTYASSISISHHGLNYRFRDSTISWWSGGLFRVAFVASAFRAAGDRTMRGMIFEHGGSAAGPFNAVDCVFRNLDVARSGIGATRCVFEDNRVNFAVPPDHTGIIITDCVIGPPAQPMRVPRTNRDEAWLRRHSVYKDVSFDLMLNPGVVERVSLPVEVTDGRGRPVEGAAVMIDCPDDPYDWAVIRSLAVTDAGGLTPDNADGRALVIVRRELRPTDDPALPEIVHYTYKLRVEANGFTPQDMWIRSEEEIPRPLEITLER